ncbi:MAG TPA: serine/threonine-protein kinase, partial [Polyangiales bacterium]
MISGKWRLDALIGVGGMAAVYMATHRNGSMAALKILHDEVVLNSEVRERFLREAYIANKVNHAGTVKVLDDDKDESGTPYIVMELLRGDSVEARAQKSGGRLSIEETLDILEQTLAVLEAAHAQTIVHRDLKPENLFMTDQGQLKVLDFGIARLREDKQHRRTQTGMVMGTPSFMAPEQAMGRWNEVDARTDLWALGATGFTLLTGLPVHEAETAGEMLVAAATRPARSLARVLNGAPFPLVAMIDRALAYERDNRFPDAHSFRQEIAKLRAALSGEQLTAAEASPQKPIMPATMHGDQAPLPLRTPFDRGDEDDDEKEKVETYDPSSNSDEEVARLAKFFSLLERALTAIKQYSKDHPEPKRRFDEAFRELAGALMTCDIALAWNLTPYSFGARELPIWEPEAPWNRVPYQLFADGVRTMGFAPGLDQREFEAWVRIIMLDPTTDFAPEDDLVTLLWDASLEHVFFQAIDSFAEGNQDQRARYEAERANVVAGAHVDHRAELSRVVENERVQPKKGRAEKISAVEKSRELFKLLSRGDTS